MNVAGWIVVGSLGALVVALWVKVSILHWGLDQAHRRIDVEIQVAEMDVLDPLFRDLTGPADEWARGV